LFGFLQVAESKCFSFNQHMHWLLGWEEKGKPMHVIVSKKKKHTIDISIHFCQAMRRNHDQMTAKSRQ